MEKSSRFDLANGMKIGHGLFCHDVLISNEVMLRQIWNENGLEIVPDKGSKFELS
jgi:hypothetical protein